MNRLFTFLLLLALGTSEVGVAAPWDWCRWALERLGGRTPESRQQDQLPATKPVEQTRTVPHGTAALGVRFEELSGRLDFLLGVLRQHPNLVTSNLSFRRSLLDTLAHVSKVQKLLGAEAAS